MAFEIINLLTYLITYLQYYYYYMYLVTLHKSLVKTSRGFREAMPTHILGTESLRLTCVLSIGVNLAGILGGRMASAEVGSVPSGVAMSEVSLPQPVRGSLGERRELPKLGPGQSPGRKRILAIRGHRMPMCLYDKIWVGNLH